MLLPDLSTVLVWITDTDMYLDSTLIKKFEHASNLDKSAFGLQSILPVHLRNIWPKVHSYLE